LILYQFYTRQEQRDFLKSDHGWNCHEAATTTSQKQKNNHHQQRQQQYSAAANNNNDDNLLVQRFDSLPPRFGTELWKYCVLYTGVGNVYWQPDNLIPLHLIDEILGL
jgi:hypothetical protein